jgi:nicotinamidase-related amidase
MTMRISAEPYDFPRRVAMTPGDSALVIVDMQHDFCSPGGYWSAIGGDPEILAAPIPKITGALNAARRAGLHIVHTRVGRRSDVIDADPEGRRHAQPEAGGTQGAMGRHLVRGEPGWQIVEALTPRPGESVIDKPATGAFHATDLDHVLRARGVQNLIVCGVTTAICVSTTVREASDRGYDVLVLGDACAEGDPAVHQAALESFMLEDGLFAAVTGADAFVQALG